MTTSCRLRPPLSSRSATPRRPSNPRPSERRAVSEVLEGCLVGETSPPSANFDGHIADRHAALHREGAERLAAVFNHVPDPATGPDAVEDTEHEVLGADVRRKLSLDRHGHRLRPSLRERLGREDVLDLARPDAEREGPERAVGSGVGVAADYDEPRG